MSGVSDKPAEKTPTNRSRVGAVSLATLLAFTSIGVVVQAGTAAAAPVPPIVALDAPAPVALPLTTTGVGTGEQTTASVKPLNGAITLVSGGVDVSVINLAAGDFLVNQVGGYLAFEPRSGFSGVAPPVTYKITNNINQSSSNTYTATVTKPAGPTAGPADQHPGARSLLPERQRRYPQLRPGLLPRGRAPGRNSPRARHGHLRHHER